MARYDMFEHDKREKDERELSKAENLRYRKYNEAGEIDIGASKKNLRDAAIKQKNEAKPGKESETKKRAFKGRRTGSSRRDSLERKGMSKMKEIRTKMKNIKGTSRVTKPEAHKSKGKFFPSASDLKKKNKY